jgi:hypothetical protein
VMEVLESGETTGCQPHGVSGADGHVPPSTSIGALLFACCAGLVEGLGRVRDFWAWA